MLGRPTLSLRVEESGALLVPRGLDAEVLVGKARGRAAARRAVDEADLNQVGLDDFFYRVLLLLQRGAHVVETDGAARVLLDDHQQELPVHLVEAERVDLHAVQRVVGDLLRDAPVVLHVGEVAHAPEQSVRYARRAARSPRNLARAALVDLRPEYLRRAPHDGRKLFVRVEA